MISLLEHIVRYLFPFAIMLSIVLCLMKSLMLLGGVLITLVPITAMVYINFMYKFLNCELKYVEATATRPWWL